MKRSIKSLLATLVLSLCLAAPAMSISEGEGYYVNGEYAKALAWFHKEAARGNVEAEHWLGLMYFDGDGVLQNYVTASSWLRKAAEKGHTSAESLLGEMYLEGKGVPQDWMKASVLFRNAAEKGDAAAQFKLGKLYANGQGISKDIVLAHKWVNLAASQLSEKILWQRQILGPAQKVRDLLAKKMTPAQIAEAQRLAREWKPKK